MATPAQGLSKFSHIEVTHFFRHAFRAYKSVHLDILSLPKKDSKARVLPIISSKIANAPTRNLWKRRIRALFYEQEFFHHGFDYMVILKKPALKLPFQEFKPLFISGLQVALHNALEHNFQTAATDTKASSYHTSEE